MGFLDGLFGADGREQDDGPERRRSAILINAGLAQGATANNAFGYALELDEAGHQVQVFLDGKATRWPGAFSDDPDRPFNHNWGTLRSRGLLAGACGYCADAFDQTESVERANIGLLSDSGAHAPSVGELAEEGYELVTIG
jgi:hypothetical protein